MLFCRQRFFTRFMFSNISFISTIRVSNRLGTDQTRVRRFVGPDLGPICLQMSSACDTCRQRVIKCFFFGGGRGIKYFILAKANTKYPKYQALFEMGVSSSAVISILKVNDTPLTTLLLQYFDRSPSDE